MKKAHLYLKSHKAKFTDQMFYSLYINGKRAYLDICVDPEGTISYTTSKMKDYKQLWQNWRTDL